MNDLEELKSLLFGAEKETLDSLNERVDRPETRAADVADVLAEAVRLSHRSGAEFVAELKEPVGECLKESIHESPQDYADALYPVMGPAIRRSISQTLKAFTQQINQTMEQSLSAKYLKWRFQASRAGIPFGEFVLQKTLLFRVEQAYLISRENGLLVSHVHHDASRIKDSDAVSAMFTAIQDFVKESFSPDRTGRLEVADMGEFSLWAVHGPHALLVCVIRGVPPKSLRAELSSILERIHFRYGDAIKSYAGDTSTMQGVDTDLNDCLTFQAQQEPEDKTRRLSFPLIAVLFAVFGALAYFAYSEWQLRSERNRLVAATSSLPGLYIDQIGYENDAFILNGMRDPLAASVEEIAGFAELDIQQIKSNMRPFHSLDPEIVTARAIELISAPDGVVVTSSSVGLVLSGQASQEWIDSLLVKIKTNVLGVPVDAGSVESIEWQQLLEQTDALSGAEFHFATNAILGDEAAAGLRAFAPRVQSLARAAVRLGGELRVSVTGFTDGEGSLQYNIALSERRAEVAKQALVGGGVDALIISTRNPGAVDIPEGTDRSYRKAVVELDLVRE